MKKYVHDPRLFDDCDPYRIPFGEPGYDPFLDNPLPRLTAARLLDASCLAVREAILEARMKRYEYSKRYDRLRDVSKRAKLVLARTA